MNQGQASRDILRIQNLDQIDQFVRRHGVTDLDSYRIANAAKVLHMGAVDGSRSIADPGQMSTQIIVAQLPLIRSCQCLFVDAGAMLHET